ncbi:MAG: shikimate kinase [Microcystaceae cyanobacterium]
MKELLKGVSIFLIGMMGSGKTTVGKIVADRLDYHFFDTDELIVKVTKKTINEIFEEEGEERFRGIESQILAELSAYKTSVIATGGGIVLKPVNWSFLHHGLIVWLDAPIPLLCQRLAEDDSRPLLQETDLESRLETLWEERRSLYSEADLHISIKPHHTPEDITDKIFDMIPSAINR